MSSAAKAHEPTMEEILASIRRIISDDEPERAMTPGKPAPGPDEADALGHDDIDAMFTAMDTGSAPAPKPDPKAATSPEPPLFQIPPDDLDIFELTEDMAEDLTSEPPPAPRLEPAPAPKPEVAPAPAAPPPAPPFSPPSGDSLLSANAGDAVSNAFGSLAHTILASNARTLDDIVKEMLRPMLKAWLDDNLPPLVERLVRAEIERVARGGR